MWLQHKMRATEATVASKIDIRPHLHKILHESWFFVAACVVQVVIAVHLQQKAVLDVVRRHLHQLSLVAIWHRDLARYHIIKNINAAAQFHVEFRCVLAIRNLV